MLDPEVLLFRLAYGSLPIGEVVTLDDIGKWTDMPQREVTTVMATMGYIRRSAGYRRESVKAIAAAESVSVRFETVADIVLKKEQVTLTYREMMIALGCRPLKASLDAALTRMGYQWQKDARCWVLEVE